MFSYVDKDRTQFKGESIKAQTFPLEVENRVWNNQKSTDFLESEPDCPDKSHSIHMICHTYGAVLKKTSGKMY